MYYSHPCSYCSKVFYVWANDRLEGAQKLYAGIKKHLVDYGEDHKEYEFDDDPSTEVNEMYRAMAESEEKPAGGYPV